MIWVCWRIVKKEFIWKKYVSGWIILKIISKFEREEVKWIGLAQNGDNFWSFVNPVMNIFFHKIGNFLNIFESKLSEESAVDYSVHKYIYRSCVSGTSNITFL